jgi:hypothetical protein
MPVRLFPGNSRAFHVKPDAARVIDTGTRADVLRDGSNSFRRTGGKRVAVWIDRSLAIIHLVLFS